MCDKDLLEVNKKLMNVIETLLEEGLWYPSAIEADSQSWVCFEEFRVDVENIMEESDYVMAEVESNDWEICPECGCELKELVGYHMGHKRGGGYKCTDCDWEKMF